MLAELTVNKFMSTLSSAEPVPGGGSAAALAGATACSLIAMVANLTAGKKGYEAVWEEMAGIQQVFEEKSKEFLEKMDKDADSYADVISCFQLPKGSDEEKAKRSQAIQNATYEAARIPMEVAEKAAELFDAAKIVIAKGNRNAASDGAVAALMARSCVLGALYNVKINAVSLKDETAKNELLSKAEALERFAEAEEKEVLGMLSFR